MNKIVKMVLLILMGTFLGSTAWAEETKEVYTATTDSSGVQKVEMAAGSYFFKPNNIIVKVNTPVEMTVKKEPGAAPHDIVLHASEAGMDFNVELGTEPKVVRFTPTKTGKYTFYCDHRFLFWTHRSRGMEGILEVTE